MSTKLDDLSERFKPKAFELLARFVEAGIAVRIVCTRRTEEEQRHLVERGASKTMRSKHLTGDAIDVVPIEVMSLPNWSPNHPSWRKLGRIGTGLWLRWGGDWGWDFGHFEFQEEA